MPQDIQVRQATITEIRWDDDGNVEPVDGGLSLTVQFNPETLSLNHGNQHAAHNADSRATQRTRRSGTTLSFTLWFDVTADLPEGQSASDVREITRPILNILRSGREGSGNAENNTALSGIRFEWGTFRFDGTIDSVRENIELFSHEGTPLRCELSVSLTERRVLEEEEDATADSDQPGTSAQTPATQDGSFQDLAASAGLEANWKAAASLNGIENPLDIEAGAMLDLNLSAQADISIGGGVSINAGGEVVGDVSVPGFSGSTKSGMSASTTTDFSATAQTGFQVDAKGNLKFP